MASFKYIVTVQEPDTLGYDSGGPCWVKSEPVEKRFTVMQRGGRVGPSAAAMAFARAQHTRPDGTTITIQRARLEGGILWPYRRYEVQGGVVRRVDR